MITDKKFILDLIEKHLNLKQIWSVGVCKIRYMGKTQNILQKKKTANYSNSNFHLKHGRDIYFFFLVCFSNIRFLLVCFQQTRKKNSCCVQQSWKKTYVSSSFAWKISVRVVICGHFFFSVFLAFHPCNVKLFHFKLRWNFRLRVYYRVGILLKLFNVFQNGFSRQRKWAKFSK